MVSQKSFLKASGNTRWNLPPYCAISILIPLAAGSVGAIFSADSVVTMASKFIADTASPKYISAEEDGEG